jgi:hypothetical protein
MSSKIGFWAFIIGLIICVIAGFVSSWSQNSAIIVVLIILGLIVGFLNITAKEITLFLVATIALIVTRGAFSSLSLWNLGKHLDQVFILVATLMAPAAIVAAIKALWAVGKPGEAS